MVSADRLQADAEQAQVQAEMARSRLRYAEASRVALSKRWKDAQDSRRMARQTRRDWDAMARISNR